MVSDAALSRSLDDGGSLCAPCSCSSASLLLRLTEGHLKLQRLGRRLDIVLPLTKAIPWALVFVVALLLNVAALFLYVTVLLMALSQSYDHPFYALLLCYLLILFLHRFLTALPAWCSFVANVRKIVCSAVSTCWK